MTRLYITVFFVSCSVLIFEISLIRIFSISLWYHFAFMVISIAMLGIGSAGTVLAVCFGNIKITEQNNKPEQSGLKKISALIYSDSSLPVYSSCAGISILLSYIALNYIPFDPVRFSWEKFQIFYLALYCLILSIPFFFSGLLIATIFLIHSKRSMKIYSSDLTGAGTGALLVLVLLNIASPEYAILIASTLCLTGTLFIGKRTIVILSFLFLLINLLLFFTHPDFLKINMSQYKSLPVYLKYPGAQHLDSYNSSYSRLDTFKSPGIRYAPGLSLKYLDELPDQTGIAIDGAEVNVITSVTDESRLKFLEFLPASVAYETVDNNEVLIIDPKGGLHVLLARYYGAHKIHKVESDPFVLKIVKNKFSEYSGGIFETDSWTGYGRNFLHRSANRVKPEKRQYYDLIDLPMTGTSVTGNFGISENYRYTVEAFIEYLGSLKENGLISINLYLIPPARTEFRILATIAAAFDKSGINNFPANIATIRSWDSLSILVKKSPFTDLEIGHIKKFAANRNFDLVYYPGISQKETNRYIKSSSNIYLGFKNIINPETRSLFIDNYLFDIKPVYDENPFFHYFLKTSNIKAIYQAMGGNMLYFINNGYLLPVILLIIMLIGVFLILTPVLINTVWNRTAEKPARHLMTPVLVYFGMIGLGFMLVEISIIQKSILILENPSYSVAVIIAVILISSGIGSMLSSRFPIIATPFSLLFLAVLICVYNLSQPLLFSKIASLGLYARIPAVSIAIFPMGFLMGLPLPMGIKLISQRNKALIPWAWAINASFSVLAPILAIMIAISSGFNVVLWISALAYLTAFASMRKLQVRKG